ncbi:hypothetical protein ACFP81_02645 [Deinococcus lacus]|uniref:Uncharacterized protein n=1 Tax=Deinococcus lacus TaxID=392561 RepID=A0ABW1YA15_9DEIO
MAYLNRQRQSSSAALPGAQTDMTSVLSSVLGGMLGGAGANPHFPGAAAPSGGELFPGFPGAAQSTLPGAGAANPNLPGAAPAGGLLGTLNNVLDRDGDGSALDDLIGLFGRR